MEKVKNEDGENNVLNSSTTILEILEIFISETFNLVNFRKLNEEQSNIQFYLEMICINIAGIIQGLKEPYSVDEEPYDSWLQRCIEILKENSIYSKKLIVTWVEKNRDILPIVDFYMGAIEDANISVLEYLRKMYESNLSNFKYVCSPQKLGFFAFTNHPIKCFLCQEKVFYFFPFKGEKYCINCLANGYSSCGGNLADWIDMYCELILMENTPQYIFHKCLERVKNRKFTNTCNQCQCESYSYIENFGKLPISPKLSDHFGCTCSES